MAFTKVYTFVSIYTCISPGTNKASGIFLLSKILFGYAWYLNTRTRTCAIPNNRVLQSYVRMDDAPAVLPELDGGVGETIPVGLLRLRILNQVLLLR